VAFLQSSCPCLPSLRGASDRERAIVATLIGLQYSGSRVARQFAHPGATPVGGDGKAGTGMLCCRSSRHALLNGTILQLDVRNGLIRSHGAPHCPLGRKAHSVQLSLDYRYQLLVVGEVGRR
jgi:hypothetical protein